jgi:hypothetical protein
MAQFANIFGILVGFAVATGSGWAGSPEELGVDMAATAYEAVCWYELLKKFPPKSPLKVQCLGKARFEVEQAKKMKPAEMPKLFGERLKQNPMSKLPDKYKACEKYLKDVKAKPDGDESDVLKDGKKEYPLKAFSYCMMSTLKKVNGDKAIKAVKSEITHSQKEWKQTLLDRENEARARHGVQPLKMLDELTKSAQKWADKIGKDCRMYHSQIQDRMYKGNAPAGNLGNLKGYTGENLMAGSTKTDKGPAAYISANYWYDEIRLYPYPGGFKGQGTDPLFPKIGHFTQMVWKGTKYVGYGYAQNPKCKNDQGMYVVAHYYPIGNIIGDFVNNVTPPKK